MPLRPSRSLVAMALAALMALPVAAQERGGNAGAYLAARMAAMESDYREAARWYGRLIETGSNDPATLEGAAGEGVVRVGGLPAKPALAEPVHPAATACRACGSAPSRRRDACRSGPPVSDEGKRPPWPPPLACRHRTTNARRRPADAARLSYRAPPAVIRCAMRTAS